MADDLGLKMVRLRVSRIEQDDDARIAEGRSKVPRSEYKKNMKARSVAAFLRGKLSSRMEVL